MLPSLAVSKRRQGMYCWRPAHPRGKELIPCQLLAQAEMQTFLSLAMPRGEWGEPLSCNLECWIQLRNIKMLGGSSLPKQKQGHIPTSEKPPEAQWGSDIKGPRKITSFLSYPTLLPASPLPTSSVSRELQVLLPSESPCGEVDFISISIKDPLFQGRMLCRLLRAGEIWDQEEAAK